MILQAGLNQMNDSRDKNYALFKNAYPSKAYKVTNNNARIIKPLNSSSLDQSSLVKPVGMNNLGLNSDRLRAQMVNKLRVSGITDERVLAAMQAVPRHKFVDQGLASRAYENDALPIGYSQTISQPWVVAYMLAAVCKDRKPAKILEIGAGCGYQAAVMAQFIGDVYAVERIKGLYDIARNNLASVHTTGRVHLTFGDGILGLKSKSPFDAIVLAAAGVKIPETLLQQLSIGARLIAPVGESQQKLILIERTGKASWRQQELHDVRFVPLRSGTQS